MRIDRIEHGLSRLLYSVLYVPLDPQADPCPHMTRSGHTLPALHTCTGGTMGDSYCGLCVCHPNGLVHVKYSFVAGYVLAGVPAYYITKKRTVSLRQEGVGQTYGSVSTYTD